MDAVFAVMPFADIGRPALGVSLLAAEPGRPVSPSASSIATSRSPRSSGRSCIIEWQVPFRPTC